MRHYKQLADEDRIDIYAMKQAEIRYEIVRSRGYHESGTQLPTMSDQE